MTPGITFTNGQQNITAAQLNALGLPTLSAGDVTTGVIAPNAVTVAQMQQLNQACLFGNLSGSLGNAQAVAGQFGQTITQIAHGFTVGAAVQFNGTSWVGCSTATLNGTQIHGVVSNVVDANDFTIVNSGLITNLSGLTAGAAYYLSSVAGMSTTTLPGSAPAPVFYALSSTTALVCLQNPASTGTGFRNRLINGGMLVNQRAITAIPANTATYCLDRWQILSSNAITVAQTNNAMVMTGAAGNTNVAVSQRIEAVNIQDLAGQVVTLTVTVSASALTTLAWQAVYPTAVDNYATVTLITGGTWTISSTPGRYAATIALPAGVTNGLAIYLSNQALPSGTLTLTNAQVEAGAVATPFEVRPYGLELALCQRYFYKLLNAVSTTANATGAGYNCMGYVKWPVTMRVAPTVTSNFSSLLNTSTQVINGGIDSANFYSTASGSGTLISNYSAGNTAFAEL